VCTPFVLYVDFPKKCEDCEQNNWIFQLFKQFCPQWQSSYRLDYFNFFIKLIKTNVSFYLFIYDDQAPDSELNMFDPFIASQINTLLGYNNIHRYKTT